MGVDVSDDLEFHTEDTLKDSPSEVLEELALF
jgi:hypothetical protein